MELPNTAWKVSKYRVFTGPYSVRMQEKMDRKNSVLGHFSRSAMVLNQRRLLFRHYHTYILYGTSWHSQINWNIIKLSQVRFWQNFRFSLNHCQNKFSIYFWKIHTWCALKGNKTKITWGESWNSFEKCLRFSLYYSQGNMRSSLNAKISRKRTLFCGSGFSKLSEFA